ncbi:hypothetical protein [Streptosporangium vulgare]|uniref:hypothetical protein n=1 Tax=Streptosporangium vulgare TaxID=46190 RepID=UPI0031DB149D
MGEQGGVVARSRPDLQHALSRLHAELVDLGAIAKSEGISYEEAIDRFGSQSSNSRVIDKLNEEFPDEISGVRYVDDQRGLRVGFKGPIPTRAIELARTPPHGGHPDRRQGILGPWSSGGPRTRSSPGSDPVLRWPR